MSKNLNKIIAFAIGVSVFTGSVVPVMAVEVKNTNTQYDNKAQKINGNFTVEDAMNAAINNSEQLAIERCTLQLYNVQKDCYEDLQDWYDDNNSSKYDEDLYKVQMDKYDNQLSAQKQKIDFLEDLIKYNTRKLYNEIVLDSNKITLAEENIRIKTDSYNQEKLKEQLGLSTSLNLKTTESELTKLKDDVENQKKELNDSIYKLGLSIGKDLSNANFSNNIVYNKFTFDGTFDEYMEKAIKDITRYKVDSIEITKDYLSDLKDKDKDCNKMPKKETIEEIIGPEPTKPNFTGNETEEEKKHANELYKTKLQNYKTLYENTYSQLLKSYENYKSTQLNNQISVYSLNITEDVYRNTMKENYTKLQGIEDSIKQAQNGLEILNENVRHTKLQYDLGLVTKNQYDQIVYKQKETQLNLETAIDKYNQLKGMLEQPWMMSVANS